MKFITRENERRIFVYNFLYTFSFLNTENSKHIEKYVSSEEGGRLVKNSNTTFHYSANNLEK